MKTKAIRAWHSAKRFGASLLVAGLITAPCAGAMVGCQNTSPTQTSAQDAGSKTDQDSSTTEAGRPTSSGIWAEPYKGEVLQDADGNYYMAHRIIVEFKEPITKQQVEELTREFKGRVVGQIPRINAFELEVAGDIDQAIEAVKKLDGIDQVARNYYFRFDNGGSWDNDIYEGQNKEGLWWVDKIQLSEGLNLLEGSGVELYPTTIAVIESGSFTSSEEVPYVDKSYHRNFTNNSGEVFTDYMGIEHGKMVSMFIAAVNNGKRTNGVASRKDETQDNFKILPLTGGISSDILFKGDREALTWEIVGDHFAINSALEYVGDMADELNIRVVNMSLGRGPPRLPYQSRDFFWNTQKTIDRLAEKGIILVASAGNDDSDACGHLPAARQNVISVGATAFENGKEVRYYKEGPLPWGLAKEGSNYSTNSRCLTVAAPGEDVLVFNHYKQAENVDITMIASGTSFSAPMVAGLVALMKSIDPTLTYEQVVQILTAEQNSDEVKLGDDDPNPAARRETWRRINVKKVMQAMLPKSEPCEKIWVKNSGIWRVNYYGVNSSKIYFSSNKLVFLNDDQATWFVYDLDTKQISEFPVSYAGSIVHPIRFLEKHVAFVEDGKFNVKDLETGETKVFDEIEGITNISNSLNGRIIISTYSWLGIPSPISKVYLYEESANSITQIMSIDENVDGDASPGFADLSDDKIAVMQGRGPRSFISVRDLSGELLTVIDEGLDLGYPLISGNYVLYKDYQYESDGLEYLKLYDLRTSTTRQIGDGMTHGLNTNIYSMRPYDMDEERVALGMNELCTNASITSHANLSVQDLNSGEVINLFDLFKTPDDTCGGFHIPAYLSEVAIQGHRVAFALEKNPVNSFVDEVYLCTF
ncbi:MAG: S8 family serine peptidase [archaeon]